MSNIIFLNNNAKKEVLLACKRVLEATARFAQSELEVAERGDLCRDVVRTGDIYFGVGMYSSFTDEEMEFLIERHDGMELWTCEKFAEKESEFRKVVLVGCE